MKVECKREAVAVKPKARNAAVRCPACVPQAHSPARLTPFFFTVPVVFRRRASPPSMAPRAGSSRALPARSRRPRSGSPSQVSCRVMRKFQPCRVKWILP